MVGRQVYRSGVPLASPLSGMHGWQLFANTSKTWFVISASFWTDNYISGIERLVQPWGSYISIPPCISAHALPPPHAACGKCARPLMIDEVRMGLSARYAIVLTGHGTRCSRPAKRECSPLSSLNISSAFVSSN